MVIKTVCEQIKAKMVLNPWFSLELVSGYFIVLTIIELSQINCDKAAVGSNPQWFLLVQSNSGTSNWLNHWLRRYFVAWISWLQVHEIFHQLRPSIPFVAYIMIPCYVNLPW